MATTTAKDSTANNNDGTLVNSPGWVSAGPTANIAKSLSFDGLNDYVDFGVISEASATKLTVEFWIDFRGGTEQNPILTKWDSSLDLLIDIFSNKLRFFTTNGPSNLSSSSNIPTGFTHVACVYDGADGSRSIYFDGALDASDTNGADIPVGGIPTLLGKKGDSGSNWLDGRVADLRLWSTARTQTEIQNNKDVRLSGTESGLVGYWKLDDGELITTGSNATFPATLSSIKPAPWPLSPALTEAPGLWRDIVFLHPFWEGQVEFPLQYPLKATVSGGSSVSGKIGTVYNFDGSHDLDMGRTINLPDDVTIFAIVEHKGGTGFHRIISQEADTGGDNHFSLSYNGSDWDFRRGEQNNTLSLQVPKTSDFEYLLARHKKSGPGLLKTRNDIAEGSVTGGFAAKQSSKCHISNFSSSFSQHFNGTIAFLGLWSRALNENEHERLFSDPFAMLRPRSDL